MRLSRQRRLRRDPWPCGRAAAQAAGQSESAVVVELYTSQGCSSCPPADEFFAELVQDPQVIPLALHVDYWDYIGWEDKFAQAASSPNARRPMRARPAAG